MEGSATMYMRIPMSTSTLPVQGKCSVSGKVACLRFPFTGIEFELPDVPSPGNNFNFRIRGARGDLVMSIDYIPDLDCYSGVGKEGDDNIVIRFSFWGSSSPMTKLPLT